MKTEQDKQAIYDAIFEVVRRIPRGRVSSYGAVAKAVGLKAGARMVGRAMSFAPAKKPAVPVQRVVNSAGVLSGDNGYRQKKLEAEGIQVKNNKIVDFKTIFWDPLLEIDL